MLFQRSNSHMEMFRLHLGIKIHLELLPASKIRDTSRFTDKTITLTITLTDKTITLPHKAVEYHIRPLVHPALYCLL